ncbi:hypothetical protein M409DRAFT_70962 [Zasmidium cellare ATCC 36951]|uniref:LIP-domain-containing protein n=1 Tax=Zasmidium cellare ATCC 36951 TaxID=1080233 RepID=A0A6A6C115_ZASCE|nr:uncharacterized protein M409DRAFT_70962 [Zasmidium cellare ATCC 36951]KAF2159512.1 hypothetical protein M409DRAFT_70962 [Zasmidium cellare ATCC 36951]
MQSFLAIGSLLATAVFTHAAPSSLFPRAILKPTEDPFYQPPTDLGSLQPGEIIRSRTTPGPIGAAQQYTSINIQTSYQLLYRTTDALGNASAAAVTIIIPHNPSYDKVLAYQTAYDSSDPNCSPSYTLQQKSNETTYDPLFMAAALEKGWIVSTSDYEGLEAQYVAGLVAGYATLDSVRATLASGSVTGVSSNATYALWGYSGGALASEWALELQPSYAPELKFAGAALGGLTPNVTTVLQHVNKSIFAYQAFAGINGIAKAYPNVSDYVAQTLIPEKAAEYHAINFQCTNDTNAQNRLDFQDISTYFKGGFAALNDPIPQSVITYGASMGFRATPQAPLYVYKAIGDEISPVADTDALVSKYCAAGATIQYARNAVGEHVAEAILGSGGAFGFLMDRFEGKAVTPGCVTENVAVSSLDVSSFEGFGTELLAVLAVLLLQPLGPRSLQGI